MPLRHRRIAFRVAFVIVLVVLLYAGLRERAMPEAFDEEDKLHHLLGFAALALSTRLAFPDGAVRRQLVALLGMGACIEWAQALLPARTPSIYDMLANLAGVVLGLLLARSPWVRRAGGDDRADDREHDG